MSKIVPKLNLNKTPQLIENGSMIYAKNIKLLKDGSIGVDDSVEEKDTGYIDNVDDIDFKKGLLGYIVGLNNIVYLFKIDKDTNKPTIYEYNEIDGSKTKIKCNWSYSGGSIHGLATMNNTGETILTICEYGDNINVPIKHINLSKCKEDDDESIYTQTPNIFISNLHLDGYYSATIPNGVYQFFIRYKIRDDFYTPWYPCSGDLYAGVNQQDVTVQGSIRYIDTHKDSSKSFKFTIEHLFTNANKFEAFQLGFILTNNDSTVARSWKTFDFLRKDINFTYDKNDIEEINIDDLLKVNYELFNVGNITYYKDKEYIANYEETNFNPEIDKDSLNKISVELNAEYVNVDNTLNINNKVLSDPETITIENENIVLYTKLDNQAIGDINDVIELNISSTESENSITANNVLTYDTYWDKRLALRQSNHYQDLTGITAYTIAKLTNKITINDEKKLSGHEYSVSNNDDNGYYWKYSLETFLEDIDVKGVPESYVNVRDNYKHNICNIPKLTSQWLWSGGRYNSNDAPGFKTGIYNLYKTSMRDTDSADSVWNKEIKNYINETYPNTIITKITLNNNNLVNTLYDSGYNLDTPYQLKDLTYKDEDNNGYLDNSKILNGVISKLGTIEGISENGVVYCRIEDDAQSGKVYPLVGELNIEYVNIDYNSFTKSSDLNINTEDTIRKRFSMSMSVTPKRMKINISNTVIDRKITEINHRTLMPFTKYQFYIHFVKQNGIVTNGYRIGEVSYDKYTDENKIQIIYPSITNVPALPEYKAWFVSIYQSSRNVARGFNHYIDENYHYIDCLECDTLLYNLNKNIRIYRNDDNSFTEVTREAEYFSSGNSTVPKLFGNAGVIRWKRDEGESVNNYESITDSARIPITNGEASGTLNIEITKENGNNTFSNERLTIDLSNRDKNISIKTYIETQLQSLTAEFGDNITYSITSNLKPEYDSEKDKFSELLTSEEEGIYFNYVDDNWEAVSKDNIIILDEDSYNRNVNARNVLANELSIDKSTYINNIRLKADAEDLKLNKILVGVQNANLAIGINSVDEENYTIKASRTGAYTMNDQIVQGNCSPTEEPKDENPTPGLENKGICEEGQVAFETPITDMTLASATTLQLADSIDATQKLISNINDDKYNITFITDNEITAKETKLSALNDAISNYETNLSKTINGKVVTIKKDNKEVTIYDKKTIFKKDDAISFYEIKIESKDDSNGFNNIYSISVVYNSGSNSENGGKLKIKKSNSINSKISTKFAIKRYTQKVIAKTKKNNFWVVIDNDKSNNENKQLSKITPYIDINTDNYDIHKNMYLPAFLCTVEKLDHVVNDIYYINGTDVYNKEINDNNYINLELLEGAIGNHYSGVFWIPSNFNLNMLSLREDLTTAIRTYTIEDIEYNDESEHEIVETQGRQTFKAFNSIVASTIYELPSMYKDYVKQYYSTIDKNKITRFDNTVRSSNVNTDEVYRNIFTFDSTDYYNVPANRGKIVYMFTILDTIFIHNQHALYKFSGKNSLTAEGDAIALKPTEAFDNGIAALLDSINGYGGLKEKHHGLVMTGAYIFYDAYSKNIYAFSEQGGIANISEPISKLFSHYQPNDIIFVGDEPNDRFFANLKVEQGNICLSFNIKAKQFISIHDIDYTYGFNTRTKTYLVYIDEQDDTSGNISNWYLYSIIETHLTTDKNLDYQKCKKPSAIHVNDVDNPDTNTNIKSAIDIIYNQNYETIKVLNDINWIVSDIKSFDNSNDNINMAEEVLDTKYAGSEIRIYSDQCHTNLIIINGIANNETIENSYKLPRFNNGIWSFNYFRDIKNTTDEFNYNDNVPLLNKRKLLQEDSLLYGKYFVFRIIFYNSNFKLENVIFNVNNYEKV